MTADVTTPRINVLDPEFYVDPWDAYRWLREEAPVFWDPVQKLWAISRYDDIIAVEVDGARYSSFAGSRPHLDQREDRSIINMDDPAHQQQRNLVARRFTPGAVRNHEEHVRGIAREILDGVAPRGECEAIEAIASRLPAIMIGDLLGYPRELWERVRHWSEQIMLLAGQTSPDGPPHESHPGLGPVIQEFFEMTIPIVKERQADPRDDLISIWATTEGWDTGHVLDETILVLNGGAETTRTVIGSMIRELGLQPDQRQLLLDRPELVSTTAVEEFIRWVTPVLNMRRTVTVDHELHGQQLHEGDEILLLYGAANRDPSAFDDPDVLNVARANKRHVAFGFGTHFCLGAHVARLEIRVMFEEMLQRIPHWELVDPDGPQIMPASFARLRPDPHPLHSELMRDDDIESRLTSWVATQLPDAHDVRVNGLDRVEFGHSAETLLLTVAWRDRDGEHREDVVIRIRPPEPGLLPPYNLGRQFEILRALEPTPVRSPRAWWYEGTGDVLERDFYVMERLPGTVYERVIPQELLDDPERVRRMCEDMVDQIAAIHSVDLRASGLDAIADGRGYLGSELDHWGGEVRRVQRGPLPGLERLEQVLRERRPEQCPTITLVHGDAKPGNFAFVGGEVTAVFDWEMALVGDPLADIGWAEVLWVMPGSFNNVPGTPSVDELIARWEERTGIRTQHREWYRAFQLFKMAVIGLVGARLFDDGHSDDLRFNDMAYGVPWLTALALTDLGIEEELETGPVFPREERVAEVREKTEQR